MLADLVLLVHLSFVLFVVLSGVTVLSRRWMAWLHLPAPAWGVFIEIAGGICPLTPLEQELRARAGQQGDERGVVEHYVHRAPLPGSPHSRTAVRARGVVIV